MWAVCSGVDRGWGDACWAANWFLRTEVWGGRIGGRERRQVLGLMGDVLVESRLGQYIKIKGPVLRAPPPKKKNADE